MPKRIVASRYLKPAAKGTRSNLVKYIATRETVQTYSPKRKEAPATENQKQLIMDLLQINLDGKKLPEYSDYLKNPSKENASELLSELLEQSADLIADKEILVKYVAERPGVEKIGKHGLFSDSDDEIILSQPQKNIAEHQGNVWSHVISLTREDAERLGYIIPEMWRNLIMRHTDDIAKAQNIRLENLRWYAAFHNTAHHPHIHLLVYSTDIKEGFLTENGIEQIKRALANDIFHNELYQVYEKQTLVRDKLRSEAENVMKNLLSELQNNNQFDPQLEQLVLKLQSQLRNSKGKKVYGYLQPNVKKAVDQIVAALAQNPVLKKMYNEWCALEQQKYETYTNAVQKFPPLEENKVFKPIKNTVIRAVLEMDFLEPNIETEMIPDDEILLSEDFEDNKLHEDIFCDSFHMNWRGDYRTARDFLDDKQYEKAFEVFQKEAAKGNVTAIYSIAKMYRRGLLGKENTPKAREYFAQTLKGFLALEPSAGKMQPYIWYHLGRLYNFGYGTDQDYSEAFKWFEKAALAENGYAQYSLGNLCYYGNGTEQNYEKAFEWYKKSADQNNSYACYEVAKMLRNGIGTEINTEQSEKYFRKAYDGFRAAEKNLADDKMWYRLGRMLLKGIGCDVNPQEAAEFFRKSTEKNNMFALCEYGKMLVAGEFVMQDIERGIEMLTRSAELGNPAASYALGKIYLFGNGVDRDIDLAQHWLTISAEAGNEYAKALIEHIDRYNLTAAQNAVISMLFSFGRLISDDYNRSLHGQRLRTEHKLKAAIRRKKQALGLKENPLENPQFKG